MCGIVAGISDSKLVEKVFNSLKTLEYRGYDSSGIAIVIKDNKFLVHKSVGGVSNLADFVSKNSEVSGVAIGHTRWATHGKATSHNAHPHCSSSISIVHNGIIENHEQLKAKLTDKFTFHSETDSEVIVYLIEYYMETAGISFVQAAKIVNSELIGSYAFVAICNKHTKQLVAVSSGSPLVIGYTENEIFTASDPIALNGIANEVVFLESGDVADLTVCNGKVAYTIYDEQSKTVTRPIKPASIATIFDNKNNKSDSFMHQEIYEQPRIIRSLIHEFLQGDFLKKNNLGSIELKNKQRVHIIGCGSSYYAAMLIGMWFEEVASMPAMVSIASEFRYQATIKQDKTLYIIISQSGETADTLMALRKIKQKKLGKVLVITNVEHSTMARETDDVIYMKAGPEIGVASTKTFMASLICGLNLVLAIAGDIRKKKRIVDEVSMHLAKLPSLVDVVLEDESSIKALAQRIHDSKSTLFIARSFLYPIAAEGALKLKEISYIHAQAYPAGELKHGPLALIEGDLPTIALVGNDHLLDKMKSNISEVLARDGTLYLISERYANLGAMVGHKFVEIPNISTILTPLLFVIPLQLLAYHTAKLLKHNIDKPRNLAKSVTVE